MTIKYRVYENFMNTNLFAGWMECKSAEGVKMHIVIISVCLQCTECMSKAESRILSRTISNKYRDNYKYLQYIGYSRQIPHLKFPFGKDIYECLMWQTGASFSVCIVRLDCMTLLVLVWSVSMALSCIMFTRLSSSRTVVTLTFR